MYNAIYFFLVVYQKKKLFHLFIKNALCVGILILYCVLLNAQSTPSVSSQFFDMKLTLLKGSILYTDSTAYIVNENKSTSINRISGDTIFLDMEFNEKRNPPGNQLGLTPISISKSPYILTTGGHSNKFAFHDWDIRPLTIPIKIRPKLDDNPVQFSTDVSIGPYLGYQFGTKTYDNNTSKEIALTLAVFATPTAVGLNNSTVDSLQKSSTLFGISAGFGLLLDLNGLVQFGIVVGRDWIGGEASKSWIYQNKNWISFSLGYQLSNN